MSKIIPWLAKLACKRSYGHFLNSLQRPQETQDAVLRKLLHAQAETEHGRHLGISRDLSREEFRARVPICDFDDGKLAAWIEEQRRRPKDAVIAPGGVRTFENTSGSSGRKKAIPYNRALLSSFDRYFRIWLFDLLSHGPKLESFRTYLSVSPALQPSENGEKHQGFDDDTEYVSPLMRWVLRRFLTVPGSLKSIRDPNEFLDQLCAHLAADQSLEILSIWHPSFFLVAWDHLLRNRMRVADLIESLRLNAAPETLRLLRSEETFTPLKLWPTLKLISAWDSASSEGPALYLRKLFPNVSFQGKGLLATEAPMTIPLIHHGQMPFLTEVLFEFQDGQGGLHWIDELNDGSEYGLIVSQSGGLLRYRMRDRVRVRANKSFATPCLEFIGRDAETSDMVGEKLSSEYVTTLEKSFAAEYPPTSVMALPYSEGQSKPRYVVLLEAGQPKRCAYSALSQWWDQHLQEAYHFGYARNLGQLGPTEVVEVQDLRSRILAYYQEVKGIKMGDAKVRNLISRPSESLQILNFLGVQL